MSSCLVRTKFHSMNDLGIFHAKTSNSSTTKTSDFLHSSTFYGICNAVFACQISFQLNISFNWYWSSNLVWRTSFENLLDLILSRILTKMDLYAAKLYYSCLRILFPKVIIPPKLSVFMINNSCNSLPNPISYLRIPHPNKDLVTPVLRNLSSLIV